MKLIKQSIILAFTLLSTLLALGQPGWTVIPTTESHTVMVITDTLNIQGNTMFENGDYIGFFYESAPDTFECAGFGRLDGSDTISVTVYGDDGVDPGYALGETFKALIWDSTGNCETDFGIPAFDFGPAVYVTGATSVLNVLTINLADISYGSSILEQDDIFLRPAEMLLLNVTEIPGLSVSASSIGLILSDTAIIDLAASMIGNHYITFDADNCLLHDSIIIQIQNSGLEWFFEQSFNSEHWLFLDSLTLINTANTQGLGNNAIQPGDVIGLFYDSSGVEKCGGYSVYDGNDLMIRGMEEVLTQNNGFSQGDDIRIRIWDSQNQCARHDVRYETDLGATNLNYSKDSTSFLSRITFSPDTSMSYNPTEFTEDVADPFLNVPASFSSWDIIETSDSLSIDPTGTIDISNSIEGSHYILLDAYECQTEDSLAIRIIETAGFSELILAPSSIYEKYHSIYFPNSGAIQILDRHGLEVAKLTGPIEWFGIENNLELVSGDYFAKCEDGTYYTISVLK
jgi:hypothetical protein